MTVPQIQPWIDHDDAEAVRAAVSSTFVTENEQTRAFEREMEAYTGARHAIAYTNATCGLFAILKALGIGPGDEVLVPNMTFFATAGAVILAGATPVFCDVDPDTFMLTPETASPRITARTRAIIPVHLYGMAADIAAFGALAREHNLKIVEDAAQAIGVRLEGRHAGTISTAGVISFYGNKTLTTGEGGVILTNDHMIAEEVYRLKNHGRLEKGVFVHDRIGFNFSFTEMQAALGRSQLRKLDRIIADKARVRACYAARLDGLPGVRLQQSPQRVSPVYWFTNVMVDDAAALSHALAESSIQSRRFFYPLHCQPCFATSSQSHSREESFEHSSAAFVRGLSLPSSYGITEETIDRVCDRIEAWLDAHAAQYPPPCDGRVLTSRRSGRKAGNLQPSEFTI